MTTCHVCGSGGEVAYSGLHDRLFDVPGEWTLRRCVNADCGLLWLDPMPVEEDLPRLYETYYTHDEEVANHPVGLRGAMDAAYWTEQYGYPGRRSVRSTMLAALLRLSPGHRAQADLRVFGLAAKPGGRLLDVGCGSGEAMVGMRHLGWTVEGVDFDAKAVHLARARGLEVRFGSLEEQRYRDGAFDAVVMSHVLEHVPDPRALLQECWRILALDGTLVSVTPNNKSLCIGRYGSSWLHLDPPRHLHVFGPSSVRALAHQLGWQHVRVSTTIANTHAAEVGSKRIQRQGRHDLKLSSSIRNKMMGRLQQIRAAIQQALAEDAGEELILRGHKTNN